MEPPAYGYSRGHRALEICAITGFFGCSAALAVRVAGMVGSWQGLTVVLAAAASGYVAADFISGFVHWLADRYGTERTPFFGPHFIQPFREHHVDPQGITRHDFIETNGNNCIASLPVVAAGCLVPAPAGSLAALYGLALVLFSMLAIMATNQFHKWAHQDSPPRLVGRLQRWRLILPAQHHEIHHTAPFDTYYCITSGWLNLLLQKARFFELLEWAGQRCLGVDVSADVKQ